MVAGRFTGLSTVERREAKAWNWEVPLTQIKPGPSGVETLPPPFLLAVSHDTRCEMLMIMTMY